MFEGQTPFVTVHVKLVVENGEPAATVTADVANVVVATVLAGVEVQLPLPIAGTFPARTVVVPQMDILVPALDGGEVVYDLIEVVDIEAGQRPLLIVQVKFVVENGEPAATVTADVANAVFAKVLEGLAVQLPVPTPGTLPAITVVVPQIDMVAPALATVGKACPVT